MLEDYESVQLVKQEVFVYKLPPRSGRGYRAAAWGLEEPMWTGRLRIVSKGQILILKLEDKETGQLFAECPVESYPGVEIENVLDSARYFVIRLKNDNGQTMFVGMGFAERTDSFDFNVAVQDHFKHLKQEKEAALANSDTTSKPLNLGLKEGQKITLKLNTKRSNADLSEADTTRTRPTLPLGNAVSAGGIGSGLLLPPPPRTGVPKPGVLSQAPREEFQNPKETKNVMAFDNFESFLVNSKVTDVQDVNSKTNDIHDFDPFA